MRIAVIGAGLAGVSTAFELASDGHDVLVLDRGSGIATEGSFANGGLQSPAYLAAWGAPGLPRACWSWPWRPAASWLHGGLPLRTWPWLWHWQRAHRPGQHAKRRSALLALAALSSERLGALSQRLPLDHEQAPGHLVLLRHARELAALQGGLDWLREQGLSPQVLDAAGALAIEPALNPDTPLHAAIHLPDSGVANSRQFAHQLKAHTLPLGVQWRFNQDVLSLQAGSPWQITTRPRRSLLDDEAGPERPTEHQTVDAVVVCAAAGTQALLSPLGLRLPLVGVQSHSVTAVARIDEAHASQLPVAGVLDERHQVSIARQGDRVRVSGGAALGRRAGLSKATLAQLYQVLEDWFPGAAHTARALQWHGSRWLVPDGLPVIGATAVPGLWLNVGQGASGWTLACGSARLLADQIAHRPPSLGADAFSLNRLR